MPYAALALVVLTLFNPLGPATAAAQGSQSVMLAYDDELYSDRDDDDERAYPDDRDYRFGNDDEGDDSAHGPSDDDDGWDIEEYEHSERA